MRRVTGTWSLLFIVFPNCPLLLVWPGGSGQGAYGDRGRIPAAPAPLATDLWPMEAWLVGRCCLWLWRILLVISRMLCSVTVLGNITNFYVAYCAWPRRKKKKETGMERSGKTPSALRRASWSCESCSEGELVLRELLRRRTYCCCGMPLLLDCCWNICTYCFVSVYIWSQNVLRLDDYPCHWARCRPSGLFGQVITVLDSTSCHVPTLKRFKVLTWRLNSKFLTLHMQWTVMILIWKPSNPIEYLEGIR